MKNAGLYAAIFFFVFSAVFFGLSLSMDYYSGFAPGPGMLPLWINGIMLVLSILYIIRSFKKEIISFAEILPNKEGLVNVLSCIGSLILFLFIVPYTGFATASFIMLFILFSRGYKWYWGLALSSVVTVASILVFGTLLGVPLPVNNFGW